MTQPPTDVLNLWRSQPAPRRLLWRSPEDWVFARGIAREWQAQGPDRCAELALAQAGLPPDTLLWVEHAHRASGPTNVTWGDRAAGSRLILPQRVWRRQGDSLLQQEHPSSVEPGPSNTQAWPEPVCEADLAACIDDALVLLKSHTLRKVVLARAEDKPAPSDPLASLCAAADGASWVYAVELPAGLFCGLSPELLLRTQGQHFQSVALAGSRPRSQNSAENVAAGQELMAATKERKEHQLVVEHLLERLAARASQVGARGAPVLRELRKLMHLETIIEGTSHSHPLLLTGAILPTPAVCGLPQELASSWINRHEGLERGLYAGAVGWLQGQYSCQAVCLRGALIRNQVARCFAGAGLVDSSDPQAECAEIRNKLDAIAALLGISSS